MKKIFVKKYIKINKKYKMQKTNKNKINIDKEKAIINKNYYKYNKKKERK
jgi:hypothetical protein